MSEVSLQSAIARLAEQYAWFKLLRLEMEMISPILSCWVLVLSILVWLRQVRTSAYHFSMSASWKMVFSREWAMQTWARLELECVSRSECCELARALNCKAACGVKRDWEQSWSVSSAVRESISELSRTVRWGAVANSPHKKGSVYGAQTFRLYTCYYLRSTHMSESS